MKNIMQRNKKFNRTFKIIILLMALACFIVVPLVAEVYIEFNSGHAHDRDGIGGICLACVHINNAETILRHFAAVSSSLSLWIVIIVLSIALLLLYSSNFREHQTPIDLKFRLNE